MENEETEVQAKEDEHASENRRHHRPFYALHRLFLVQGEVKPQSA